MKISTRQREHKKGRPIPRLTWQWFSVLAITCLPIGSSFADSKPVASKSDPVSALEQHWSFPLERNDGFSPANPQAQRSLSPRLCGQCHLEQYQAWRESLHARAFGPGMLGQALELEPFELRGCMNCHAPLIEQFIGFENTLENRDSPVDGSFASHGVLCAACHVRQNRVYGPHQTNQNTGNIQLAPSGHEEVTRVSWFSESSFCKNCHQGPTSVAANDKPLMNTHNEWASTEFAKRGVTCQTCHMPGRTHEWKGIHDPDMVKRGIQASYEIDRNRVIFRIKNSGVGHAFPTYVTPRAVIRGAALDRAGQPIPETIKSNVIQRDVALTGWGWDEISDTRLLPGMSASVEIRWGSAKQISVWLEIDPDYFYRLKTYPHAVATLAENSRAHAFIIQALRQADANRYRLFERTIQRPDTQ